jgi:hypothetical protein
MVYSLFDEKKKKSTKTAIYFFYFMKGTMTVNARFNGFYFVRFYFFFFIHRILPAFFNKLKTPNSSISRCEKKEERK